MNLLCFPGTLAGRGPRGLPFLVPAAPVRDSAGLPSLRLSVRTVPEKK